MSRLPRFFAPGLPLHIVQRGNGRGLIFRSPTDFEFFRDCLGFAARRHAVAIHAYVLMTNHMHLLATPSDAGGVPKMMQSVGRVYVPYFNQAYGRTGGLWEGRYKATVVEDDRYFITCMRYIELNPVRAQMVEHADQYRWSSHLANACGVPDPLIRSHPTYDELAATPEARRAAYRGMFGVPITEAELDSIRDATQHAWALGSMAFCREVTASGRRAERLSMRRRK
jgi:putative transposase